MHRWVEGYLFSEQGTEWRWPLLSTYLPLPSTVRKLTTHYYYYYY